MCGCGGRCVFVWVCVGRSRCVRVRVSVLDVWISVSGCGDGIVCVYFCARTGVGVLGNTCGEGYLRSVSGDRCDCVWGHMCGVGHLRSV